MNTDGKNKFLREMEECLKIIFLSIISGKYSPLPSVPWLSQLIPLLHARILQRFVKYVIALVYLISAGKDCK